MLIRDARREELPEVGDLRVAAYVADGFMSPDSGYAPRLRTLGADGTGSVLVALSDGGQSDAGQSEGGQSDGGQPGPQGDDGQSRIVGTVMLRTWPDGGEIVTGPDEGEVRALAVSPLARRSGVGRALVAAVIERAARAGVRHLVLSSQQEMKPAHRLYEDAGFVRLPDRDWEPEPGVKLIAYGKVLDSGA
jgi:ribosomal protein S18 acetylase RimI-like enzyme